MASVSPGAVIGACAAAATIACGAAVIGDLSQPDGMIRTTIAATAGPNTTDAVRLAKQATFGPTMATVDAIVASGPEAWLNTQFDAPVASTYKDLLGLAVPRNFCNGRTGTDANDCNRAFFTATYPAMRFYANAIQAPDQLRQRVALALGETIVASETAIHTGAGVAAFNQIFLDNAFGNYRTILRSVTLNPFMGGYLNMADSNRTAPNENYARELMQLFSLGVNQMNMDGTPKRDNTGAPIATYTSADVKEVARALTGWTYARIAPAAATDGNALDYTRPMVTIAARYDTGAKTFLGKTVPANASQDASVDAVIDAVFTHANTPPFVAKALIKQLVTTNPSPAYVERVARIFADNGQGVRGDMRAIVRAVLMDGEARGALKDGNFGKVKEPILLLTSLGRLIPQKTDGYVYTQRDTQLGQSIFHSPSVFNYYPPDYPLPLGNGLESGPSKLMTTATVMARHNIVYDWTINGDQASRAEYNAPAIVQATGTQVDWTSWEAIGNDPDAVLDRIDTLMLGGAMTAAQRTSIKAAMAAITNANASIQARRRAQTALYIAATSPLFQVDR